MGWFNAGSKESNSSSSSSSTSNTTTTTAIDSRMVTDGSGVALNFGGGYGNTIQLVEGGAFDVVNNALATSGIVAASGLWDQAVTASNSIAGMGIAVSNALNFANDVTSNSLAASGIAMRDSLAASQSVFDHASAIVSSQGATNSADFKTLLGATLQLSQQAYGAMDANLSLAKDLNGASQAAYAGASEQAAGNKNIVMVGMVVVGLAAVLAFGDKF